MSTFQYLNVKSFEAWKEISPSDWQNIVLEMIDVFLVAGKKQFLDLKNAQAKNDIKSVKFFAHALKSSCGNVGASTAHKILHEIEHYHAPEENKEFINLLTCLDGIFEATLRELENYKSASKQLD